MKNVTKTVRTAHPLRSWLPAESPSDTDSVNAGKGERIAPRDIARLAVCWSTARMSDASVRQRPQVAPGTDQDGFSLPAWIYHDPEFFEVEKQSIFRT
jgi:hypothetical protein